MVVDVIDLRGDRVLRMALTDAILNEINRLRKRNRKIRNLKTYKNQILSNIRSNDFESLQIELKINNAKIERLSKLLN